MSEEQIRKDFEEWMGDGGLSQRAIGRNSMGDYILMQTAHAWEVWKAAHTHYAKSAAPVVLPEPVAAQVRFKPENDTARTDLERLRKALGVAVEPHQTLADRMIEAAIAKKPQASRTLRGMMATY